MTNLTAIHIRPIPSPDPAEPTLRPTLRVVGGTPPDSYAQETLALAFAAPTTFVPAIVPDMGSATRTSPTRIFCLDEDSADSADAFFERQMTGSNALPPAQAWSHRFAQAMVEVMAGQRSPKQLARWSTNSVLSGVTNPHTGAVSTSAKSSQRRRVNERSIVTSVRVDEPADGVAEVAAVVRGKERSRALMLRLEGWDGRWICTFAAMV
ncbi:MAG: hypothetical protein HQ526_08795 [Actinobacteria bacterium]|nr:hypothetical protein [Actinomycetota bacterium]